MNILTKAKRLRDESEACLELTRQAEYYVSNAHSRLDAAVAMSERLCEEIVCMREAVAYYQAQASRVVEHLEPLNDYDPWSAGLTEKMTEVQNMRAVLNAEVKEAMEEYRETPDNILNAAIKKKMNRTHMLEALEKTQKLTRHVEQLQDSLHQLMSEESVDSPYDPYNEELRDLLLDLEAIAVKAGIPPQ